LGLVSGKKRDKKVVRELVNGRLSLFPFSIFAGIGRSAAGCPALRPGRLRRCLLAAGFTNEGGAPVSPAAA
jgi:hypothetical protein